MITLTKPFEQVVVSFSAHSFVVRNWNIWMSNTSKTDVKGPLPKASYRNIEKFVDPLRVRVNKLDAM